MWRMLSRVPKFLIVLAVASSIGLHWAFLQSLAWVGMVVNYSQSAPLKEALQKTFDGEHPCELCKQVAEGKKAQKDSEQKFEAKKLTFLDCAESFAFAHLNFEMAPATDSEAPTFNSAPLLPPPRQSV
jgi:hypothetical protein